jgi:hypothetical protein
LGHESWLARVTDTLDLDVGFKALLLVVLDEMMRHNAAQMCLCLAG